MSAPANTLPPFDFTHPGTMVWPEGTEVYTILIRGDGDPEREARWSERDVETRGERPEGTGHTRTKVTSIPATRLALACDLLEHPASTFNAMCVRCFGVTADVAHDDVEAALWSLVEDGTVVHTMTAPIRFILTAHTHEVDA